MRGTEVCSLISELLCLRALALPITLPFYLMTHSLSVKGPQIT